MCHEHLGEFLTLLADVVDVTRKQIRVTPAKVSSENSKELLNGYF